MTNDELRVKVAELCGKHVYTGDEQQRICDVCGQNPATQIHAIPDYPNDLNACAEFEAALPKALVVPYVAQVTMLCSEVNEDQFERGFSIFATAEQRCLAFIKTMESKP